MLFGMYSWADRGVEVTGDEAMLVGTCVLTLGPDADLDAVEAILRERQTASAS